MKNEEILPVIVTGASGFIGARLCAVLDKEGMPFLGMNTRYGNIEDPEYFKAFKIAGASHIIHLAGRSFVPESWEVPGEFMRTNLVGTVNTLELARKMNASFTYVSAYVYGTGLREKIGEQILPDPSNPYALSKKMGEDACLFYQSKYDLPVTIIRPFNIYGPGQKPGFLIPSLLQQLMQRDEVTVRSVSPRRDYLHVDDLVRLLLLSIRYNTSGIFNAGTGISTSVAELIGLLEKVTGKKIGINNLNTGRINEIDDTRADISAAATAFGWQPLIGLEAGLEELWKSCSGAPGLSE